MSFRTRFVAYLITSLITLINYSHASLPSNMKNRMDEWLDPTLIEKKTQVVKVLDGFMSKGNVRIPPRDKKDVHEDYGFSFYPGTQLDFLCINRIQTQRIACLKVQETKRVPILDLGCGSMGYMTILAVLAGGVVDAVDYRETLTLANNEIYTTTQKVIGYKKADSKQFYRAFPINPTATTEPGWTKTPHVIAICKNVVHFMIQSEIETLAARLFKNLTPQGLLFIEADTPYSNQVCLDAYRRQQDKSLCPGLAINNLMIGTDYRVHITPPIPYVEEKHKIRPGRKFAGLFMEDGSVREDSRCFHKLKHQFLNEELARIFEKAGFVTYIKFYIDHVGIIVPEDQEPVVGQPSKACIMFVKPGQ